MKCRLTSPCEALSNVSCVHRRFCAQNGGDAWRTLTSLLSVGFPWVSLPGPEAGHSPWRACLRPGEDLACSPGCSVSCAPTCWAGAWMEPTSPFTPRRGRRPRAVSCRLTASEGARLGDCRQGRCRGPVYQKPSQCPTAQRSVSGFQPPLSSPGAREDRVTQSTRPPAPPDPLPSALGGVPHSGPLPAPPRAVGPVWAALTALEPSAGKPRRTGRHSSFYRPSNWGWSRRGNTKILCTQLLSVRGRRRESGRRGARLCCSGLRAFAWLRFQRAALMWCRARARGAGRGHRGGSGSPAPQATRSAGLAPLHPQPPPPPTPQKDAAPLTPCSSVTMGGCEW